MPDGWCVSHLFLTMSFRTLLPATKTFHLHTSLHHFNFLVSKPECGGSHPTQPAHAKCCGRWSGKAEHLSLAHRCIHLDRCRTSTSTRFSISHPGANKQQPRGQQRQRHHNINIVLIKNNIYAIDSIVFDNQRQWPHNSGRSCSSKGFSIPAPAYEKTLRPYHSFAVRMVISGVTRAVPSRQSVEDRIGGGQDIVEPGKSFVVAFTPIPVAPPSAPPL